MFGPASVGEFLNGTNTTESFVAASGRNKESTEVETLFGITTGVVLVINLLFTIKVRTCSCKRLEKFITNQKLKQRQLEYCSKITYYFKEKSYTFKWSRDFQTTP